MNDSNAKKNESNTEKNDLNAKINDSNVEINESNAKTNDPNANINGSNAEKNDSNAEKSKTNADTNESIAEINDSSTEINESNDEINDSNLETNESNEEANDLNAETNESNAETNYSNAETNESNAGINDLNAEINESNSEINDSNLETNESNAEINNSNAETNESNAGIKDSNAEINESNAENNDSNAEINESNAEINDSNLKTNGSSAEINNSNAETNDLNAELNDPNAELHDQSEDFSDTNEDIDDFDLYMNDATSGNEEIQIIVELYDGNDEHVGEENEERVEINRENEERNSRERNYKIKFNVEESSTTEGNNQKYYVEKVKKKKEESTMNESSSSSDSSTNEINDDNTRSEKISMEEPFNPGQREPKLTVSTNADQELSKPTVDKITTSPSDVTGDDSYKIFHNQSNQELPGLTKDRKTSSSSEITDDERDMVETSDDHSKPCSAKKEEPKSSPVTKKKRKLRRSTRNEVKEKSTKRREEEAIKGQNKEDGSSMNEKDDIAKKKELLELLCEENRGLNERLRKVEKELYLYLQEKFSIVGEKKIKMRSEKKNTKNESDDVNKQSNVSIVQLSRTLSELERQRHLSPLKPSIQEARKYKKDSKMKSPRSFNEKLFATEQSAPSPLNTKTCRIERKNSYTVLQNSGRPKSSSTARDEYNAIDINRQLSLPLLREVEKPPIIYKTQPSAINCDCPLLLRRRAWQPEYRPSSTSKLLPRQPKTQRIRRNNSLLDLKDLEKNKHGIRYDDFYEERRFSEVEVYMETVREAVIIQQVFETIENTRQTVENYENLISSDDTNLVTEVPNEPLNDSFDMEATKETNELENRSEGAGTTTEEIERVNSRVGNSNDDTRLSEKEIDRARSNGDEQISDNSETTSRRSRKRRVKKKRVISSDSSSEEEEKVPTNISEVERSSDSEEEIEITDDERVVNPIVFKFLNRISKKPALVFPPPKGKSHVPLVKGGPETPTTSTEANPTLLGQQGAVEGEGQAVKTSLEDSGPVKNKPRVSNIFLQSQPKVQQTGPVLTANVNAGSRWKSLFRQIINK